MSYKINNTNGDLLVDLIDGKIDTQTTDLTLVGRNYTGYGEAFNENFIKLLENFASATQPDNPIRGQLWYDTSDGRLKLDDGEIFRSTDTTAYSSIQPTLLEGDIWIDSSNKQMYFSDGSQTFLAGPNYTRTQGKTDIDAISLIDRFGVTKTVGRLSVGGVPVAIISKESFEAANIDENVSLLTTSDATFSRTIRQGFNLTTNLGTFYWQGTAQKALSLEDNSGNPFAPADFIQVTPVLSESTPQTTNHYLQVASDFGLLVGATSDFRLYTDTTDNDNFVLQAQRQNKDINIKINNNGDTVNAITVDSIGDGSLQARVGILNTNPSFTLDINGDTRITGNLIVQGTTTSLDTAVLKVEDKQIELALTNDSTLLSDALLDDAGIVVQGADGSKDWTWKNLTNSWTSHSNVDVGSGFAYKIGGQTVLTNTTLASTVTRATGLIEIGTLQYLNVDSMSFNGSTVAVSSDFRFVINGDLVVSLSDSAPTSKIKNVADPTADYDVANKKYVDESEEFQPIWLSLDITGLTNTQIARVINDLVPATSKRVGVECKVHCVSYSASVQTNPAETLTKTIVNVDSNGVQNQAVLADVGFNTMTDTVNFTITRSLKQFEVDTSQEWVFIADLVSSV
jgi:hypothetical protein